MQMGHGLEGETIAETYKVTRQIGAGGMGTIYEAEHIRVGRRFALKLLAVELSSNEEVFQRFKREAEIAGRLGHPNIVEVVDFNRTERGVPYIVMEMLKGEDLAEKIARDGAFSLQGAYTIIAEVVDALEAAHAAGVVHRDLKPQNIFLCKHGRRTDFVKLLDFGISKMKTSDGVVTKTNAVMGTPYYMSPEQAEGRNSEIDSRTDIFALGAIIYEMLTGRLAFYAPSVPTAMFKVCYEEPTPIEELVPNLPEGFAEVLGKALKKDREERYASAAAFWEDFDRIFQGQEATFETGIAHKVLTDEHDAVQPGEKATTLSGSASQIMDEPPRRTNMVAIMVGVIGIVAIIGAAVFAFMVLNKKDRKQPPPRAAVQPMSPSMNTMEPVMRAERTEVTLTFYITPKHATLKLDGKAQKNDFGKIKRVLTVKKGEKPISVTVAANGFAPQDGKVIPFKDYSLQISLLKAGQVAAAGMPGSSSRRRRRRRRGSVKPPPMGTFVIMAAPAPRPRRRARPRPRPRVMRGGVGADSL